VVYGVGPVTKRDPRFVTVPHAFALRALNGQLLEVHESGLAPIGFVHLQDAVSALIAARPASGYAPANAVSEVLTVVDVARVIERAGALRGLRVLSALPDVAASNPPTFSVTSRLSWAEWTPAHRLEATASDLLDHYASQRVEAV
jgi:nucleoside-diphosphate-sugar epimerase